MLTRREGSNGGSAAVNRNCVAAEIRNTQPQSHRFAIRLGVFALVMALHLATHWGSSAVRGNVIDASTGRALAPRRNLAITKLPPPPRIQRKSRQRLDPEALHFGILGHGKCGTTTMMRWLQEHPEVSMFEKELTLMQRDPQGLAERLLSSSPKGAYRRGYKSPSDIYSVKVAKAYREHFPNSKLIVGIRHPVRWFESLYNFRVQNGSKMPGAQRFHFLCARGQKSVCSIRAAYHNHLQLFGKTDMEPREMELFTSFGDRKFVKERSEYTPNQIYLYDSTQLGDSNATRIHNIQRDVQRHLDLTTELPPPLHIKPGRKIRPSEQALRDGNKMDICEPIYALLRAQLVDIGRDASTWIINYFLKSPDVKISNEDHFRNILSKYKEDPCAQ